MEAKNKGDYTVEDIDRLPDFINVELIDGEIITDDWTELVLDDSVLKLGPPTETKHIKYTLIAEEM